MSAAVTLSPKLPGDAEINGLDARAAWMEEHPDEILVSIVYTDTSKVTIDTDSGAHVPTQRVRRWEPLGTLADVPQAVRDAMAAAEEKRTGRAPIPFEVVEAGEYAVSDTLDDDED